MSLYDLEAFLRAIHPFQLLNRQEMAKAMNAMNIAYYKKDTTLIAPHQLSEFLYIIIKGEVGEYNEGELIKVYSKSNSFDADALIYGKSEETFTVLEELICYELKKEDFLFLLEVNTPFKEYFIQDLANKIQSAKQKEYTTELSGFMMARVQDSYLHEPTVVGKECSIMEALKQMELKKSSCIIVELEGEDIYGIVTDSVVRRHVLFNEYDKFGPIGPIALHPMITIEAEDYLFNALLSFTKYSIKRIVVMRERKIIGILEQLDLLSYFANHTYLVAVQIRKAESIEDLKQASCDLINIVKKLQAKGTKVDYIAKLISEINEKIYEKLYTMIMPKELAIKACLVVMGSEGRKEQLLKTDQDNALIIADDMNESLYFPYMQTYTQTLIDFGFPRCEGDVMVSNPYWCKHAKAYISEIKRWFDIPSMEDYLRLAIFFDAICVAGDASMLANLKTYVYERVQIGSPFMANFAKAAVLFETPIGLFTNLIANDNKIDVKKGGIFPIVHGVRSLALENAIPETDTVTRIKKLAKISIFDDNFADTLIEALDTLLNLRLKERFKKGDNVLVYDNFITISTLNQLELELLKDSFKIVNKFKKFLTHHFKLGMVS
ncbi:MAG: putative nucleotidyltransferase substrate binding domain-containing protein [Sulfurospirillaceae bacterium]|nr:putative nucleotidyltransferase substrate binding domain-containing protein [Sulfurospirillaceae bacterium]MDD2826014.1 putative nucleotidyltransferase substrate binding domain-containing protein [Sulfurospirillaceae bacterium]